MSVMQHRVARLEAIHGKADSWDAVVQVLTDKDLELALAFVRHRLAELGACVTDEPDLDPCMLTGAHLRVIVAQGRA